MFGESFARDIYSKLARQSRSLWLDLEKETGKLLLHLNGGLDIVAGANSRNDIRKIASVFQRRGSDFDVLDSKNLSQRYPQWRVRQNTNAIYSPDSGILKADDCLSAAVLGARKYGVVIKEGESGNNLEPISSEKVLVKLESGRTYCVRRLIVAAGPWMPNILKRLGVNLPLSISQEQTVYFAPRRNLNLFTPENFPVWEWEEKQFVYGFPIFESGGIKLAFHQDGHYLDSLKEFRQTPSKEVIDRLGMFLNRHIPDAAGEAFGATTCLYTNTPDNDFVIDTIPGLPSVAYFTGDSGHAFHCAPALGRTLTELLYEGKTSIDISCFSSSRFKI